MNVVEIVKDYLTAKGFEGLTDEDGCGCGIDDLIPCQNDQSYCIPAYEHLYKNKVVYSCSKPTAVERKKLIETKSLM